MLRSRLYAILGLGCAAIAIAAVLYVNNGSTVHAGGEPPAVLDKLKLVRGSLPAPDVAFVDADGKPVKLADFRGRYVLVNLWATWCGPCVNELPSLARLSQLAPGLKVLAVDTADRGTVDAAGFLKSHKAGALAVYRDNEVVMMRSFGAYGLPMTILIDPSGKIVAKAEGPADWGSQEAIAYFKRITGT